MVYHTSKGPIILGLNSWHGDFEQKQFRHFLIFVSARDGWPPAEAAPMIYSAMALQAWLVLENIGTSVGQRLRRRLSTRRSHETL
eukprot:325225-Amphidinium_carterae.1